MNTGPMPPAYTNQAPPEYQPPPPAPQYNDPAYPPPQYQNLTNGPPPTTHEYRWKYAMKLLDVFFPLANIVLL